MTMQVKTGPAGGLTTTPKGDVTAAFAQLNVVDHEGDLTLPGAFPSGVSVPISAWGHASWTPGYLPVGRATISESGSWALAKGRLFLGSTAGRDTFAALDGLGSLAEWSFGYQILKATNERIGGAPVRVLRKLAVFEVSPVLKGAGLGTHTVALAAHDPAQLALARLDEANRRALLGVTRRPDPGQIWARREHARLAEQIGRAGRASAHDVAVLRVRLAAAGVR